MCSKLKVQKEDTKQKLECKNETDVRASFVRWAFRAIVSGAWRDLGDLSDRKNVLKVRLL